VANLAVRVIRLGVAPGPVPPRGALLLPAMNRRDPFHLKKRPSLPKSSADSCSDGPACVDHPAMLSPRYPVGWFYSGETRLVIERIRSGYRALAFAAAGLLMVSRVAARPNPAQLRRHTDGRRLAIAIRNGSADADFLAVRHARQHTHGVAFGHGLRRPRRSAHDRGSRPSPASGDHGRRQCRRPAQSGFSSASIVYQAPVDGGEDRYMLIFQEGTATDIGPVRSARPYYVYWAAEYKALFGHYGGDAKSLQQVIPANIKNIYNMDDLNGGSCPYHRIATRASPHNAYTNSAVLISCASKMGYPATYQNLPVRTFRDDSPLSQLPRRSPSRSPITPTRSATSSIRQPIPTPV